jgi:hypothetical protein
VLDDAVPQGELREFLEAKGYQGSPWSNISEKGWQIERSEGTLGNYWHLDVYRVADEKEIAVVVRGDVNDPGTEYAGLEVLRRIIELEVEE